MMQSCGTGHVFERLGDDIVSGGVVAENVLIFVAQLRRCGVRSVMAVADERMMILARHESWEWE